MSKMPNKNNIHIYESKGYPTPVQWAEIRKDMRELAEWEKVSKRKLGLFRFPSSKSPSVMGAEISRRAEMLNEVLCACGKDWESLPE